MSYEACEVVLRDLEIPKYAQNVILPVLADLGNGTYHEIRNSDKAIAFVLKVIRAAAGATSDENGFIGTVMLAKNMKRIIEKGDKDSPLISLLDDMAGQLILAAQARVRRKEKSDYD